MANLTSWMNNVTASLNPSNQQQLNALKSGYQTGLNAENASYGNSYKQAQQTLNQIPSNYNGLRNSADITKNQALSWLPQGLANNGAATDSGANYQARTNVGNTYQNTMNTIGQEQNKAQQQQQNAINTLGVTHQGNLAKLNSTYQSDLASALATQRQNILSQALTGYNAEQSREEQAAEAAASRAEAARESAASLAEKEYEYNQSQASAANKAASELYSNTYNTAIKNYAMPMKGKNAAGQEETFYHIENPTALLNYIDGSGLTDAQKNQLIDQIPYHTSSGQTLSQYIISLQHPQSATSSATYSTRNGVPSATSQGHTVTAW